MERKTLVKKRKNNILFYLLELIIIVTFIIIGHFNGIYLIISEIIMNIILLQLSKEIAITIGFIQLTEDEWKSIRLSTEEANEWNLRHFGLRNPLRSETLDKATKTEYIAQLSKNKYGETIFTEKERTIGTYYFDSLIFVIMTFIIIVVMICSIHDFLIKHEYIYLLMTLFIIPFEIVFLTVLNDTINGIKEKRKNKSNEKQKLGITQISYITTFTSIIILMIVGFSTSIIKNIPDIVSTILSAIAVICLILFVAGLIAYIISSLINFINEFISK